MTLKELIDCAGDTIDICLIDKSQDLICTTYSDSIGLSPWHDHVVNKFYVDHYGSGRGLRVIIDGVKARGGAAE